MASKKRGRKAESFVFSIEQDTILSSYLLRFEEEVTKLGILHEKYSPKLADVKRVFTTEILELPEFHSLKSSDVPLSKWTSVCHFSRFYYLCLIFPGLQTIKTKFGNHLNNVMRKKDASRPAHSSSPIASGASSQQKVASTMLNSLLFTGHLTAHKIFTSEMTNEIDTAILARASMFPDLKGGALRNKVVAELWEDADHELWEKKAKDMTMDTARFVWDLVVFDSSNTKLPLGIKNSSLISSPMLCRGYAPESSWDPASCLFHMDIAMRMVELFPERK